MFDWDAHNLEKCQKHGVTVAEIERLFEGPLMIRPDIAHAASEERLQAVGRTPDGRHVFLVFTYRRLGGEQAVRPISARFMHAKEIARYEQANPEL